MPRILARKQYPKTDKEPETDPLTQIRAQLVSMGGAVVLAMTIVVTMVFVFSMLMPKGNGMQLTVIIILFLVSWIFFINCTTEKLRLTDQGLEFSSLLARTHRVAYKDIIAYKLTDLGLQFNGSMYLLEITHAEMRRPLQISLGPCWQRHDLKRFMKTLGIILDQIHL